MYILYTPHHSVLNGLVSSQRDHPTGKELSDE